MRLEPMARPEQVLRVSAKLVASSTMLRLSADELEHVVEQEQLENPALEVIESRVCLFCGTLLYGQMCSACRRVEQAALTIGEGSAHPRWDERQHFFEVRDSYDYDAGDGEDEFDPLAGIATGETLAEVLLHELEMLVSADDALIAEQLVGNLNERGYLEMSVGEIADYLQVAVERVEYVLGRLQTLEPVGIGARDLRECLLMQLAALGEGLQGSLVYTLIDGYLGQLGGGRFDKVARELGVPEEEVREASLSIRRRLYPFPAYAYRAEGGYVRVDTDVQYVRPDVIICSGVSGFEVELVEEKRYGFRVTMQQDEALSASAEVRRYMRYYRDQAAFFVNCIQRRWHSLRRIAELVVDYQREFLEKGVRYLRPLTRTEVAARLSLDEGTVSRAMADKYALLPNGRLIPMADFFDGSLGVKDVLRELIMAEVPRRRLSDEKLRCLLAARGISVARRTVTKYREAMGIRSSRGRFNEIARARQADTSG